MPRRGGGIRDSDVHRTNLACAPILATDRGIGAQPTQAPREMTDYVEVIIGVIGGLIWLFSAAMVLGAVVAVIRPDHRNPIVYRWVRWYEHHSKAVR